MNLKELKQFIAKEVSLALASSSLKEPEEEKPNLLPQPTHSGLTDEEFENYLFHGESKQKTDENDKF